MLTNRTITFLLILSLFLMTSMTIAKDFIIFNVSQDIPMGEKDETIKKNYFMNIGSNQGVKKGTLIDVYRRVSKLDPYENKKRYNFKVKVGEIKILHTEQNASIGMIKEFFSDTNYPVVDVYDFMIGDVVKVHVDK